MSNYTTRYVIGEVAHLRQTCELLIQHIEQVGNLVFGTEELTPYEEAMIADANTRSAAAAKDHIELATRFVDDWHKAISDAMAAMARRAAGEHD